MSAELVGTREFARALRKIGPEWPRRLTEAHKNIADEGANQSRMRARGMGGVQAKASSAIRGRATVNGAFVAVGSVPAFAGIAFWGAKRHTGWYAKSRYQGSARQHDPWIGSSWEVGVASEGPYAINDALAAYMPYLVEEFGNMIDDLANEAFPDR